MLVSQRGFGNIDLKSDRKSSIMVHRVKSRSSRTKTTNFTRPWSFVENFGLTFRATHAWQNYESTNCQPITFTSVPLSKSRFGTVWNQNRAETTLIANLNIFKGLQSSTSLQVSFEFSYVRIWLQYFRFRKFWGDNVLDYSLDGLSSTSSTWAGPFTRQLICYIHGSGPES